MASIVFKKKATSRTCRSWLEHQEVCINQQMHITRTLTLRMKDGKPRILRATEYDPRACDGSCKKYTRRLTPDEIKRLARTLERVFSTKKAA